MRFMTMLAALLSLVLLAAGCGTQKTESDSAQTGTTGTTEAIEPSSPPTGEGHATADVVPGSYEDWCDEHGVAESQCTRCDPSLIPAFQAANDWCTDHGLPMSQCMIHNPNLRIVRPPKPEAR